MNRFHIIDDAAVIMRSKGVYRQAKVFVRGDGLYAGHGAGFVRLYAGGGTSVPTLSWDDIDIGQGSATAIPTDQHGKLLAPTSVRQIEGAAK